MRGFRSWGFVRFRMGLGFRVDCLGSRGVVRFRGGLGFRVDCLKGRV